MLSNKKILIVEDNVFLAIDLAQAVEALNGKVIGPVASVEDALALIKISEVSAAIVDCQLVDRDIVPVVIALVDRGVPLVIQTGTEIPPTIAETYPSLPVLRKPVCPDAVLRTLARVIDDEAPS